MLNKPKSCQKCQNVYIGNNKYAGVLLSVDFWHGKVIEDEKKIKNILTAAAKKANNTPLEFVIHKFEPQGITAVILLAESHISLHSWPEHNYVAVDIFTCGNKVFPYKALEYLKKAFQPKKVLVKEVKRGKLL